MSVVFRRISSAIITATSLLKAADQKRSGRDWNELSCFAGGSGRCCQMPRRSNPGSGCGRTLMFLRMVNELVVAQEAHAFVAERRMLLVLTDTKVFWSINEQLWFAGINMEPHDIYKAETSFSSLVIGKESSKIWPDEDPLMEMLPIKDFCREPSFLLQDNSTFLPTCDVPELFSSIFYSFHFWQLDNCKRGSTSMWVEREVLMDYVIETASPELCLNRCVLIKSYKQTWQSICWDRWREFFFFHHSKR